VGEPPVVTFGGLLRLLRTEAGLTQEELAEAAGLGARTVSDLERGVARTARKQTARRLANALRLAGPARQSFEAVAQGRALTGAFPRAAGVSPGRGGGGGRRRRPGPCPGISPRSPAGSRTCGSWLMRRRAWRARAGW
jgi:DNA-binding XRE family transcriptional regulator